MSYIYWTGVASNDARATGTVPSLATIAAQDYLDVQALVALKDWTPSATNGIIGRFTSTPRQFGFYVIGSGVLRVEHYDDANTATITDSSAAPTVSDGERLWIRAVIDGPNETITFYTGGSADEPAWVQLGTVRSIAGKGSLQATTVDLLLGSAYSSSLPMTGQMYRAIVATDIATLIDADFTNLTDAELDDAEFVDDAGMTINILGSAWAYPRVQPTVAGTTPQLLLKASKHIVGVPMWSDISGNDHHAQLGSAAGADTNDPLFKPWDGVTYAYLPGTSGNYVSSADVNLLNADTAHMHQSIGGWISGGSTSGIQQSTALAPIFGDSHGQWTSTGATSWIRSGIGVTGESGGFAASPATEYTFSAYVAGAVTPGTTIEVRFAWYNSSDAAISTSAVTQIAVPSTFTQISVTVTSPALTDHATVQILARTSTAGDVLYWDALTVSAGSDSSFVPSLRIVGDLDIRAKVRIPDFSPAADLYICGTWDFSVGGYALRNLAATGLSLAIRDAGGTNRYQNISQAQLGVADDDLIELRVTCDVSDTVTGINWYVNDALVLNGGHAISGGIAVAAQPFQVGRAPAAGSSNYQPMDSDYVELRDGIDGPVVARYDAADAEEPFATQVDAETGRTWTYNRSASGLVTTVVDRAMFLLTTDDYFEIADDDALDFDATASFTYLVVHANPGVGGEWQYPVGKYFDGSNPYYRNYLNALDSRMYSGVSDGTDTAADQGADITFHQMHVFGSRLDRATNELETFLDGVGSGSPTDTSAVGDLSTTYPLRIGRQSASYLDGKIVAVALWREALTDAEIAAVGAELSGSGVPQMMLMGVG